jgi:regulator of replication initiation timing
MEALMALEEKVKALVLYAKGLNDQLQALKPENNLLKLENSELKAENAQLVESNAQLTIQLNTLKDSMLLETDQVHELKEERLVTRSVLDDLIKSIDSIVENEN